MNNQQIIDCHVHVTENGRWYHTDYDASIDKLLQEIEDSPISSVVLLPVAKDAMGVRKATEYVKLLVDKYPDKFIGFYGYHKGFDIEREFDPTFQGLKIHPRLNEINILDEELESVFEQATHRNMPVLIDSYCTPISNMSPEKIRPHNYWKLAQKYPNLKIIMAHSGMPFIWEAYPPLKWYPNLFADISHILFYFKNTSLIQDLAWVVKKIPHKICYGSDFPEVSLKDYFNEFVNFCRTYNIPQETVLYNINKLIK